MKTCHCFACGGLFPDTEGPVHRYMDSTPGCWATFGEVLAREYNDASYFAVHRLTVDSYAVQHPGVPTSRQCIHSIGVHLVRLCLFLEHGLTPENANSAMQEAAKNKHNYVWLQPPELLGHITVADIAKESTAKGHQSMVRQWAQCVWDAWSPHHSVVRAWAQS